MEKSLIDMSIHRTTHQPPKEGVQPTAAELAAAWIVSQVRLQVVSSTICS